MTGVISQPSVVADGTPHHIKEVHLCQEQYSQENESTAKKSVRLIQVGSSSSESSDDTLSAAVPVLPDDFLVTSCQEPGIWVCSGHWDEQAGAALHKSTTNHLQTAFSKWFLCCHQSSLSPKWSSHSKQDSGFVGEVNCFNLQIEPCAKKNPKQLHKKCKYGCMMIVIP